MANVAVECPYCMTTISYFGIDRFYPHKRKKASVLDDKSLIFAPAECENCGKYILCCFRFTGAGSMSVDSPRTGQMDGYQTPEGGHFDLLSYHPSPEAPNCPDNCPPNVEMAFLEAEKARRAQAFTIAAGGYRRTIDRAITPLVDEKFKSKMLGQKLGNLEAKKWLPDALIDWIRLVKDDGNFALHDDDRDFKSAKEIEHARTFTRTLLTYLFTMKAMVEAAKVQAAEKRKP